MLSWDKTPALSQLLDENEPEKWARRNITAVKEDISNVWFQRYFRRIYRMFSTFESLPPMISVSGVDGAGKSTVLVYLRELLEGKYRRKLILLRHRPCVLPILSSFKHG